LVVSRLRATDYSAVLEFVHDAHDETGVSISQALVDRLRELIPSEAVTYRETDGMRREGLLSAADPEEFRRVGMAYPLVRDQDPFPGERGPVPSALLGHAVKFSDVMTLRHFRNLDFYDALCRPVGVDYVMKLFLPMPGRGCSVFIFDRGRRDFTERERDIVDVLYPHLLQLRNRGRPSMDRA
jgi:hypothetical protein